MHINGGTVRMATYDRCAPRFVTVNTNEFANSLENNVALWPPCTRIERCAGCCATDSMVCEPLEGHTELVEFSAMRYIMPNIGAPEFIFGGFQTVQVERHLKCAQRCRVKAYHCNPNIHDYLEYDCRCKCKQVQSCPTQDHIWRESTCKCECTQREQCVGFARWNEATCQCDIRQVIMADLSDEERQELRQMLNGQEAPTTTTTTTTTPAPTRPANDGCPPQSSCLPGWAPRRFGNGRCSCMPSGFGFGRKRRSIRH